MITSPDDFVVGFCQVVTWYLLAEAIVVSAWGAYLRAEKEGLENDR